MKKTYTNAEIEIIRHYIHHAGLSLPQAIQKVKAMTAEEIQAKREKIAEHTIY